MTTTAQLDAVLERIDREEIAELTRELVDIPSPTGDEAAIGEFMLDWFARHGLVPVRQQVDVDRVNAVGIVPGSGGGASLMINGHLDTSFTGTDEDRVLCRDLEPVEALRGEVRDGRVYGLGASNMKGGLAAFMVAGKAVREAGVALRGDLILAGVVGEISRTPIDEFQAPRYRGEGHGTRHLLTHGVQSDYAIVADGSALSVIWTQTGVAQFKITTTGKPHSAWGVTREQEAPLESNAVLKAVRLVDAVDGWAERFEADEVYQSANGPIIPKVVVGAIRGGAPYRPNYYPGVCSIYVDTRFGPHLRPLDVRRRLAAALDAAGIEYELEMYRSLMGYEATGIEQLARVLENGHRTVVGEPTPTISTGRSSIWTDLNVYVEMGIPTVKFGPRGKRWTLRSEQVEIEELDRAARVFALAALEVCNWEPGRPVRG